MPIGNNSIKRAAKAVEEAKSAPVLTVTEEPTPAPAAPAEKPAKKAPAKKSAEKKAPAKKEAKKAEKKPAAKKPTGRKPGRPKKVSPVAATGVVENVSPVVVAAMTGNAAAFAIGEDLPVYLL